MFSEVFYWSGSVAWLARTTDNREVASSNLARTIPFLFEENFLLTKLHQIICKVIVSFSSQRQFS